MRVNHITPVPAISMSSIGNLRHSCKGRNPEKRGNTTTPLSLRERGAKERSEFRGVCTPPHPCDRTVIPPTPRHHSSDPTVTPAIVPSFLRRQESKRADERRGRHQQAPFAQRKGARTQNDINRAGDARGGRVVPGNVNSAQAGASADGTSIQRNRRGELVPFRSAKGARKSEANFAGYARPLTPAIVPSFLRRQESKQADERRGRHQQAPFAQRKGARTQ